MPKTEDRVKETTTTTGTGTITLAGAASGFQAFSDAFSTGDVIMYAIVHQTLAEWEVGRGTLTGSTTFARDIPQEGSAGNDTLVNFSAGTKDIFATVNGNHINRSNIGRQLMYRGCTWPQTF